MASRLHIQISGTAEILSEKETFGTEKEFYCYRGIFAMRESETSAIARKLQNYYRVENYPRRAFGRNENAEPAEPGIFKNFCLISLMGLAVFFTQLSVWLVTLSKKWEQNS